MLQIILGSWNIRTMTNLQSLYTAEHKIVIIIDRGRGRYNINIAALHGTRLADYDSLKEKNYIFFWSGKASDDRCEADISFAIYNEIARANKQANPNLWFTDHPSN